MDGKKHKIKVLSFDVERPSEELQRDLFLDPEDFVYKIVRLLSLWWPTIYDRNRLYSDQDRA